MLAKLQVGVLDLSTFQRERREGGSAAGAQQAASGMQATTGGARSIPTHVSGAASTFIFQASGVEGKSR